MAEQSQDRGFIVPPPPASDTSSALSANHREVEREQGGEREGRESMRERDDEVRKWGRICKEKARKLP